jgi:hypothetical protein
MIHSIERTFIACCNTIEWIGMRKPLRRLLVSRLALTTKGPEFPEFDGRCLCRPVIVLDFGLTERS